MTIQFMVKLMNLVGFLGLFVFSLRILVVSKFGKLYFIAPLLQAIDGIAFYVFDLPSLMSLPLLNLWSVALRLNGLIATFLLVFALWSEAAMRRGKK